MTELTGISLETYAAISASMAEGDRTREEVLREAQVPETIWLEAQVWWNRAILLDEMGEAAEGLAEKFSDAFARAQDALKPTPELEPEEWAAIRCAVASSGVGALAERGLSATDYARLARRWTALCAGDATMASRYNAAMFALTSRR